MDTPLFALKLCKEMKSKGVLGQITNRVAYTGRSIINNFIFYGLEKLSID
ncbi:MAG: hypothetical protein ACJAW8_000585 [Oleispira sp.]|jgi:hypothetical protein